MTKTPMTKFALPLALALALGASGCIRLLPKPPPPPMIFGLDAAPVGPTTRMAPKNIVISVAVPDAPRALSGSDLAWRKDDVLAYVEEASWQGRNLDLLQTLLVRTFDRSARVRGAVRSGEGGGANAEIHWDLIAFEVVEDGGLEARFQTSVKLFASRTRRLIAQHEFTDSVPMSDRSTAVAARALEQAARNVAAEIVDWAIAETPEPALVSPSPVAAPSATPAPTAPR